MRILFILKRNETYGFRDDGKCEAIRRSSGLYNSTRFIIESLVERGVYAKIIEVQDNNDIDKEVTEFGPDVVVIEALWVVPEKFRVLRHLHPGVQWFCHLHSHMPFLALEGIAMDWIFRYARQGVGLIANSVASYEALKVILSHEHLVYLPNVYISKPRHARREGNLAHLNVGCFGAIRPMKNHLLQALAAVEYANVTHKQLRFHINGSRTELMGDPVLKNMRSLFHHLSVYGHQLVEHRWHEPAQFLDTLQFHMDIGLQVSMTETFNVVTADYVTAGIPVVTSKEVTWVSHDSWAQDDSVPDVVAKMHHAIRKPKLIALNQHLLVEHSKHAQHEWFEWAQNIVEKD